MAPGTQQKQERRAHPRAPLWQGADTQAVEVGAGGTAEIRMAKLPTLASADPGEEMTGNRGDVQVMHWDGER